jgi:hypothetical protein
VISTHTKRLTTVLSGNALGLYKGVPLRPPKVFRQTSQRYRLGWREWILMSPSPICPVAGQAGLGQNVVCGSMRFLLVWLLEGFYLDPHPIVPISQLRACTNREQDLM